MGDAVVLVKQQADGDRPIDNESVTIAGQTRYRQRVRPIAAPETPLSTSKTGPLTDDVLVTVPPGSRLRLHRIAVHCDPELASGIYPEGTIKLGALVVWTDKLESGYPWSERSTLEGGDGDDLTFDLTTTATVWLNLRYELF
jgi:hypothetical protein